jgi:hypothetical protein
MTVLEAADGLAERGVAGVGRARAGAPEGAGDGAAAATWRRAGVRSAAGDEPVVGRRRVGAPLDGRAVEGRLVDALDAAEPARQASLRVPEERRERGESPHPFAGGRVRRGGGLAVRA